MNNNASRKAENGVSLWPLVLVIVLLFLFPSILFFILHQLKPISPTVHYLLPIAFSIVLMGMAFWGMRIDRFSLKKIGWELKSFAEALGMLIAVWVIIGLFYYLGTGKTWLNPNATPLLLLQQWIFVGISAEMFFRGYLLNRLAISLGHFNKKWSVLLAILLSSILFSAYHIPAWLFGGVETPQLLSNILIFFIYGIFFSYVFLRTRNIVFTGLVNGFLNLPLLGSTDDFLTHLIVIVIVIEIFRLINRAIAKKKKGSI